jgi:hypothetical protein
MQEGTWGFEIGVGGSGNDDMGVGRGVEVKLGFGVGGKDDQFGC